VNYQHGRYMIPAMVVFFLTGFWGLMQIMMLWKDNRFTRVAKRFWVASLVATTVVFLWLGCNAYQKDVSIIETEMVQTAAWVKQNTPQGSRIAAHDIGALGYYSNRKIIDLAGLVNPEVISLIRNESAIANYLDTIGADYLVTFPGWYPQMVQGKRMIFSTNGQISPQEGGENMAVYAWR
jgi:hypothetical protein